MKRTMLWLVVSGLMVLSLVTAACGPAAAPTAPTKPATPATPTTPQTQQTPQTPVPEKPQQEVVKTAGQAPRYGGTIRLIGGTEPIRFSSVTHTVGSIVLNMVNQGLWAGDWTRGPAGGYGTNRADWAGNPDLFKDKTGVIAESTTWTVDEAKNEGTIVYKIRQGVHWGLNPASEASRLLNGRELTADDVIYHLKRIITDTKTYLYLASPELRPAVITKTGPWEVTVKVPIDSLISTVSRFGDSIQLEAPEVINKYGNAENWKNSVGTGPFILIDYTPGSVLTLVRNTNYWEKDPIGPGKGNQLPYLDSAQYFIIPDVSTQQAALRTGKIDQITSVSQEDANFIRKQVPALIELKREGGGTGTPTVNFRTDKSPFNDVRVRRAMQLAIDFEAINQSLAGGQGRYPNRPFADSVDFHDLYLGLNDPEMPPEVKELWSYKPDKAKQLLKEAGYPNGFKTSVIVIASEVDSWSIYKNMWAKVGIELSLDVKDQGVYNSIVNSRSHEALIASSGNPIWYTMPAYSGTSSTNRSMIDDPTINEALVKIRRAIVLDPVNGEKTGMKIMKELTKYVYWQVYEIGGVSGSSSRFWWPWIKNYSGEANIGYFETGWPRYVWIDQDLKKSMGY